MFAQTMERKPKIILTGVPGVGKTTLVKSVLEQLKNFNCSGFITEEQRDKKGRAGFVLKTLDGREVPFASVGKGKGARVGRYIVDVDAFENIALDVIAFHPEIQLYVIDEIGPMEVLSKQFCETAKMLLKNDKVTVLATAAKSGHGFIREVKRLPGLDTIELTPTNKEQVLDQMLTLLSQAFTPNQ